MEEEEEIKVDVVNLTKKTNLTITERVTLMLRRVVKKLKHLFLHRGDTV